MALVNLQVPGAAFPWVDHAAWDGLTAADLVFPFFLVAVGLSTAHAIDGRSPVRWGAVLRRAALLFAIGVALNWALRPSPDLARLRLSGVLQRIALVYLACAATAARTRGWRAPLALALALLAAHAVLLLAVAAPGEAAPSLSRGHGLSGWLDRTLIPLRLYQRDYDPEGVLSTLSALATGLLGLAAARGLGSGLSGAMVGSAAAAGAAGLALTPWLPLNKALWTPSFALVTAAAAVAAWLALRRLAGRGLEPAAWLGRRALDFYVLHTLLIGALLLRAGQRNVWEASGERLAALVGSSGWASMLFAALAAAACAGLMAALTPRGRVLRL